MPVALPGRRVLVVSCEHAGRSVPAAWATAFEGFGALLDSHRGWDPGALELGRRLADAFGAPLHAATTTRLLVDTNRSIGHPRLFSEVTARLSHAQRREIVERYYRPHRDTVEGEVAGHVAAGRRVLHVGSHSFTPVLDGVARRADVAWLYDPRRPAESALAAAWMTALARRAPQLRLRRNYPYRGCSDGLTALLRRRHPDDAYAGIELEVNQAIVAAGGAPWRALRAMLVDALSETGCVEPGGVVRHG